MKAALTLGLVAVIIGTTGVDRLEGTAHRDRIRALGGDDHIIPGAGFDRIHCGGGFDVVIVRDLDDRLWGCERVRYSPP